VTLIVFVMPKSTFLIDPMVYPPLGVAYIASQLISLGHYVTFIDLSVGEMPKDGVYDQIWVSATSAQMYEVRKIGAVLSSYTKSKSVLGGPAVWANPGYREDSMGFDLLVSGEADHPVRLATIIDAAKTGGVDFLDFGTCEGVEHIRPPYRGWFRQYRSYLTDRDGNKVRCTTMFTSRGCPMACAFCESGRNGIIWDRIVRYEPMEVVIVQLDEIVKLGFGAIQFYDDILPLNKPRMQKIMNELVERNLIWRCFIRTDVITKQGGYEYLKEMRDAGLVEVLAGIESASNEIKDNIQKGTTIEQDTQVMKWCQELGIQFKASFVLGLPGETMETLEATRRWILAHRPDRVDVNTLIPFPGTPLTNPEFVGQYDISWEADTPEEFWYKGPRDETLALTSTSSVTSKQIREFHAQLMQEITELGIPY